MPVSGGKDSQLLGNLGAQGLVLQLCQLRLHLVTVLINPRADGFVIIQRPCINEVGQNGLNLRKLDTVLRDSFGKPQLEESPSNPPVQVAAGRRPIEGIANDSLGLHATSAVVKVREFVGDLEVDGKESLLSSNNFGLDLCRLVSRSRCELLIEANELRVQHVHPLEQVLVPEFDLTDSRGLENASAALYIRIHLHHLFVDRGVNHDPRTSSKLTVRRQVHKHGLLVLAQGIDNHRSVFQDFAKHVTSATREAPPVGKDNQREILLVEVVDGLGGLVRRVREPNLASLRLHNLRRVRVRRVRGNNSVDISGLDGDNTHGDSTKLGATRHNALTPLGQNLNKRALVKEAELKVRALVDTREHVARIVRRLGRQKFNQAIDGVGAKGHNRQRGRVLRNKRKPLHNVLHTLLIVLNQLVRNTVRNHNLGSSELVLARVDIATEQFVQGTVASQNDGTDLGLDSALSETNQVGADADRAASDIAESENFLVRPAGFAGNHTTAAEILNSNAVNFTDDVIDLVPDFTAHLDLFRQDHTRLHCREVAFREIEVREPRARQCLVIPGNLELVLQVFHKPNSRSRIAGDVDPGEAELACIFRDLEEEVVLLHPERPGLERDIICNQHDFPSRGILRCAHVHDPRDHADSVASNRAHRAGKFPVLAEHELLTVDEVVDGRHGHVRVLGPFLCESNFHQAQIVVRIGRAHAARRGSLDLKSVGHGIRRNLQTTLAALKRLNLLRNTGDGVSILHKRVGLEPLPGFRGGHEADGADSAAGSFLEKTQFDLDTVDAKLQEASRKLGDDAFKEGLGIVHHAVGGRVQLLHDVEVNPGGRRLRDLGIQERAVELVHRESKNALGHARHKEVRMRNGTVEDGLRRRAGQNHVLVLLLHPQPDLTVPAHG
mmetsp:Transcript_11074/g.29182  ORF Transcript_11074/g.29182 Transcript_11074/m.29182 type:complete len:894 (+) Transcript_11074:93-2774(+)